MTVRTAQHEAVSQENAAPAEFRRRLLEGMAAAVRDGGFRDSTVADVVRHARTSRRTFYEHFPSKQACYIALLQEANAAMVRRIAAAVDRRAPWDAQVRQAIEAWIAVAQSDLPLTMSWIRDLPSLGSDARHLQREALEAFVVLIQNLSDTSELRAAGVAPPSRQLAILLLGGLRELIATTVEDGGDIGDITEVAVRATQALFGPRTEPTLGDLYRSGVAQRGDLGVGEAEFGQDGVGVFTDRRDGTEDGLRTAGADRGRQGAYRAGRRFHLGPAVLELRVRQQVTNRVEPGVRDLRGVQQREHLVRGVRAQRRLDLAVQVGSGGDPGRIGREPGVVGQFGPPQYLRAEPVPFAIVLHPELYRTATAGAERPVGRDRRVAGAGPGRGNARVHRVVHGLGHPLGERLE